MAKATLKQRTEKEIRDRLAELGGDLASDDTIVHHGDKLVVPEKMTLPEVVEFLDQKIKDDEKVTTFSRTYNYRPWDGAHALAVVLERIFGVALHKYSEEETLFGKKRVPPKRISIPVGPGKKKQVPWGALEIPGMPGLVMVTEGALHTELGSLFQLRGEGPKKYTRQVEGLFNMVEQELQLNSIYRGQAIDGRDQPEFLDLKGVDEAKVIYSEEVMTQLNANVWAVLQHSEQMKALGMSLKRAVLLYGPYGTGKTLAAYLTAKRAVANGWTFIMVRPGEDDLMGCMQTAKLYQPAVVFFEDVDVVADSSDADTVTRLLDAFDGMNAKGTEILAMLTTNHAERIHKGMVRPGRLDAIIKIERLDQAGLQRMIEACIPASKIAEPLDYTAIFQSFDGFLPAFCKEAVERTMRYSLARHGRVEGLTTKDFIDAAAGLRPQLELMNHREDAVVPTIEQRIVAEVANRLDRTRMEFNHKNDCYELALNGARK